jgi:hypothetical protein
MKCSFFVWRVLIQFVAVRLCYFWVPVKKALHRVDVIEEFHRGGWNWCSLGRFSYFVLIVWTRNLTKRQEKRIQRKVQSIRHLAVQECVELVVHVMTVRYLAQRWNLCKLLFVLTRMVYSQTAWSSSWDPVGRSLYVNRELRIVLADWSSSSSSVLRFREKHRFRFG